MIAPRQRASAIVTRDGLVLLVRDRGISSFALPGGGIDDGELPIAAVARELYEETTLIATNITYLFQMLLEPLRQGGRRNNHHVFQITAEGEVNIAADLDVEEFVWWDRVQEISVFPHVVEILKKLQGIRE